MSTHLEPDGKLHFEVSSTEKGFSFWRSEAKDPELQAEMRAASVLIVPTREFRGYSGSLFPNGTVELFRYLQAALGEDKVGLAATDEEYEEIALHSELMVLGKFVVCDVLAPLLVAVLGGYIVDHLKDGKDRATVRATVVLDRSTPERADLLEFSYEGPANLFQKTLANRLEMKEGDKISKGSLASSGVSNEQKHDRELLMRASKRKNEASTEALLAAAGELRKRAREEQLPAEADAYWRMQQALTCLRLYMQAFEDLKTSRFYSAWCKFEEISIALSSLKENSGQEFCDWSMPFIEKLVADWQGIYPYKVFTSPEFVIREKVCSICGSIVKPRINCGHIGGKLYSGEICARVIKSVEFLGLALVSNPVQKYSVMFLEDKETGGKRDQYDYSLVKYVIDGLNAPFDRWSVSQEARFRPQSDFPKAGRNDPCPCDSEKKYKNCCLNKAGIAYTHFQVLFDVKPPAAFPSYLETWDPTHTHSRGLL